MSTRSSLYWTTPTPRMGELGWHIYYEMIEDGNPLYLELEQGCFTVTVKLPPDLAAVIEEPLRAMRQKKRGEQ